MAIPPTSAEINTALAAPLASRDVLLNIRKAILPPSVVCPEMFGAPWIEYTDLPGFNPTLSAAQDTTALVAMFSRLSTHGGQGVFFRPYGLTQELTLTMDREGMLDGQSLRGMGAYNTGLQMTGSNYNAIRLVGVGTSGNTQPVHPRMEGFFIKGGSNSGKGLYARNTDAINQDCRISNASFRNLRIQTGGDGIDFGDSYNVLFDTVKIASAKGHCFNIEGGNATSLLNCHAEPAGRGKAGYRIVLMAWVRSCTGIDDSEEICHWAMVGGKSNIPGTLRTGGSTTIVRIDAADAGRTGEYDGLQLAITAGTHAGFEGVIDRHVRADATHGNYVLLSTDTPLPATIAVAAAYNIRDAESGRRGQGAAGNRLFRGGFEGCNIEAFGRTGIRALWYSKMQINDCLIYDVSDVGPGTVYDCCIYLQDTSDNAYAAWNSMRATRFSVSNPPRYGHDIIQARGSAPIMRCEDQSSAYDSIWSQETGADLQMRNVWAQGELLQTGFPTSNPGPRRLWLNGNVLTMGT